MKCKKYIGILLVSLMVLLAACGSAKKERTINPKLIEAFGQETIAGEEATIERMIDGLLNCYEQHKKDKDVYQFITNVDDMMQPYKDYLKEIDRELEQLFSIAASEGDEERMKMLLSVQSSAAREAAPEGTWSLYKFCIDNGLESTITEQEAEKAVIEYINALSEFFYGVSVVK